MGYLVIDKTKIKGQHTVTHYRNRETAMGIARWAGKKNVVVVSDAQAYKSGMLRKMQVRKGVDVIKDIPSNIKTVKTRRRQSTGFGFGSSNLFGGRRRNSFF